MNRRTPEPALAVACRMLRADAMGLSRRVWDVAEAARRWQGADNKTMPSLIHTQTVGQLGYLKFGLLGYA